MHILHSIAIVYVQVYEFLHDFVVEILGNISQIRQIRSPARSTGLSNGRLGVPPGQPDRQPARPVCRPVGPACAPDRPVLRTISSKHLDICYAFWPPYILMTCTLTPLLSSPYFADSQEIGVVRIVPLLPREGGIQG